MSEQLIAFVNDGFMPLEHARVHVEDRGFQFADGVYEVIASFGGEFLDIGLHLQRLESSCKAIEMALPKPLSEIEALVQETYDKNPFKDAMIYIQVTRGAAPRSHIVAQALVPTFVITVRQLPLPSDEKLKDGAKGCTMPDIRWKHCEIKSIALLASVMGKQEGERRGADETFWLDEAGHVLEGCASNVFAMIEGTLVTHPLDHQVLGGITRRIAIALAKQNNIAVEEREWRLDENGLSECFLSSTTNAVLPVCFMDDLPIGNGRPGSVSLMLRSEMLAAFESLRK